MATTGRPQGDVRKALIAALQAGPATARELAAIAQVSVVHARQTIYNATRGRPEIVIVGQQRVPGANRPCRVYGLATEVVLPDVGHMHVFNMLQAWAGGVLKD